MTGSLECAQDICNIGAIAAWADFNEKSLTFQIDVQTITRSYGFLLKAGSIKSDIPRVRLFITAGLED